MPPCNRCASKSLKCVSNPAPLPELPLMPLRNTFDGNTSAYQAAMIVWFDNRRVIQSYLNIPFNQPMPALEESAAIQFSQRAAPATPVIDIDDIQTPVGSPITACVKDSPPPMLRSIC
ncbi:hypothetical protein H4Q26_003309 [Puccinia striiformis f. sp. tritici PST-130]|nr:hypothetical protein H4Q26_003309 [Puccinia striiformis f. sp. tritici PST-130]